MNPIVSICCQTYNHKEYIKECLDGFIKQQTNFEFEVLVHDDASSDGTTEIVKEYEQKYPNLFRCVYQSENQFNKINSLTDILFKMVKGKYIALCEGDDYWTDPYKLQKQVDFLEANQDYVLCFHKVKVLKADGSLVDDFITKVPEIYETQEALAAFGNYIHTPSVVFRNILTASPEEAKLAPIGDYFLYMRLTNFGKIKRLDDTMGVYRHGVGGYSSKTSWALTKKSLVTYMLIASCMPKEEVKFILLNRVINGIEGLEGVFRSEFKKEFLSNHIIYRIVKLLLSPKKLVKKVLSKLK